ncbi:MAG: UMP kinase, partial [Desulfovibrionaceae bacterium]|nr:UMP kinase [Desulfovibrionaceae bacterium]
VRYERVSYDEALNLHLGVMDATAFALVRDNHVPLIVCKMLGGDIAKVIKGEAIGTLVSD